MPTLEVPGATLEYTTTGTGPPIILVPGAPGSATVFRHLVPPLSRTRTVTTYSRRGLSGSLLHGPQDYANRLSTDADDPGAGAVTVFGTSSGALVALRLLERHPAHPAVGRVVAHEPPAVTVLPEALLAQRAPQHRALADLYRAQGAPHAVETFATMFAAGLGEGERKGLMELIDPAAGPDARADVSYWLEREPAYVFEPVDVEKLRGVGGGGKLVLCVGEKTKGGRAGEATLALAERLGWGVESVVVVPGGHVSYVTEPEALAEALSGV